MPMVVVHLTGRMGTEPILSIKRSISIDAMINFDGDGDRHGDGDGTCKQALSIKASVLIEQRWISALTRYKKDWSWNYYRDNRMIISDKKKEKACC